MFNRKKILLVAVIALAVFFRFNNLNWDENFHLHPDERFLTMVGNAMQIPSSFSQYLDPMTSPMNPANINFPFFVYGVFPLVLNKLLAVFLSNDSYNAFTIQGRLLSALFDVLTVVLVYKTAKLLFYEQTSNPSTSLRTSIPLWSAFFYAIAALPIQLSHFFAVDTFLNFFMFASFYFSLKFTISKAWRYLILSSLFFSFALASKITAIYILPLNLFFLIFVHTGEQGPIGSFKSRILSLSHYIRWLLNDRVKSIVIVFIYLLTSYLAVRLTNPYYFESSNFLSLIPNKLFVENIQQLQASSTAESARYFPPAVQWFSKTPILFPLSNIIFFGLGTAFFICFLWGIFFAIKKINLMSAAILVWFLAFFIYQATRFGTAMRYFLLLYSFIAIFAGIGVNSIIQYLSFFITRHKLNGRILVPTSYLLLIGLLLIWPISFSTIYTSKHSRVEASYWIHQNIPEGSFLAEEHWDDGLPLSLEDIKNKTYTIVQMPVFAPDTQEKWKEINDTLNKANYIIFTSNRGYGSMMPLPDMYPKMSKFYKDLFAGKLQFKLIKTIASYPTLNLKLFKTEFNDDSAEESFSVYDHPKVLIFKK